MYFLDNLRAFVVVLVIVLHAAMTYMAYAPAWWYVVDSKNSLLFTMLVLLIDVPIMQIMFFVSGYFVLPSLQKRGGSAFLKEKFGRIGLPWILGVLFLAPPTTYLIYFSRHVPMSFFQFWQTDFWGKMYQQSVYWYLGILMAMFLVLALILTINRSLLASPPQVSRPSWKLFVAFGSLMSITFWVINLFFYIDDWKSLSYLFLFQPLRLPLYIGYFTLGIFAWQHNWFTNEGYKPALRIWLPTCILSGLFYLAVRLIPDSSNPSLLLKAITALLFNIFCLASLMAALAFFETRVNNNGVIWKNLSASSYGMYYFHPLIVYPLTYLFVDISLPVELKALIVMTLGILLSWIFSSQVAHRIPVLRKIF